jgi:hypothetical protein
MLVGSIQSKEGIGIVKHRVSKKKEEGEGIVEK